MSFKHRLFNEVKEELRLEKNYKKFSEWVCFHTTERGKLYFQVSNSFNKNSPKSERNEKQIY